MDAETSSGGTTKEDAANLYLLLLGREAESEAVMTQLLGRNPGEAVRAFLTSGEFELNILTPAAREKNWRGPLVARRSVDVFRAWLPQFFAIEDATWLNEPLDWHSALLAVCRSSAMFAAQFPAGLEAGLPDLISGLETASSLLEADVEAVAGSEAFERAYYGRQCELDFPDARSAARHYLLVGRHQGICPSTLFDQIFYIETNNDVRETGEDPLLHFINTGSAEGRKPRASRSAHAEKPFAPPVDVWKTLATASALRTNAQTAGSDEDDRVDVIIPVYRGYSDTLACIHSVLTSVNRTPYRLLVIDDRSPDTRLSKFLEDLAALGLIILLKNETNLGFVGTVNHGMMQSRNRDIILLNSDTVVYGNWIDRLRYHAYTEEHVATVTPLSNNATIFSYPSYDRSNNQALEISFEALDFLASQWNAGQSIAVPTGVGFCLYLRRRALREIGPFDELLFGKGYGEENDFCMRAIEHGWVNRAALDVFVRHTGEVSFAAGAEEAKRIGLLRLTAAHPRYEQVIRRFIERDPFREGRARLDVARFAAASKGRGVLMVEHGWGGGIERHIQDLVTQLDKEGRPTLVATPLPDRSKSNLRHLLSDNFPNLPDLDWAQPERCAAILEDLDIELVHIHSVAGVDYPTIRKMISAFTIANILYDYTIHDYSPICPRITMIDWSGRYCASPSPLYCATCIDRAGTSFGKVEIADWRDAYHRLLNGARRILVPDQDVADRICSYMDLAPPLLVRPHIVGDRLAMSEARGGRQNDAGVRRIGVIGAIGEHKGSRLLRLLCADALERKLPLHFNLYGYVDWQEHDVFENLTITGPYTDDQFSRLFRELPSDLALFFSLWPETFSYTLDHAFANIIYPVAFDFGAPARRIKAAGFGEVLPIDLMYNPSLINDRLIAIEDHNRATAVVEPDRAWVSVERYYDLGAHHARMPATPDHIRR